MFGFGQKTVYRSYDAEEWKKCKELLTAAGIRVHAWVSEEQPACGCGPKIDVRKIARGTNELRKIYLLDVPAERAEEAEKCIGKSC
jgi:hypothetical protein